ncbi:hypothetical protein BVX98_06040, partial [bacterium F11]
RDVGVDAKLGRIYLPLDHLEQFGVSEMDLLGGKRTPSFLNLMQFEAKVARSHFKRAGELLPEKWKKALMPARIMGNIYMALLAKLEKNQFPVFEKKVTLGFFEKSWATFKEIKEKR